MELRKKWCFEVLGETNTKGLKTRGYTEGVHLLKNGGVGESVKDTPPPAGKSKDTGKVYETARIG